MIDPLTGPCVFDTSAQSYFSDRATEAESEWLGTYSRSFPPYVSVITVLERMRGYWLAHLRSDVGRRSLIEQTTEDYLSTLDSGATMVLEFTTREALISAHLMALHPSPPSPPRRSHRGIESRRHRLNRWRFDIMIASTALVRELPLIHNNPADFEPLRAVIERFPDRFPGVGPLNLISVRRLAA